VTFFATRLTPGLTLPRSGVVGFGDGMEARRPGRSGLGRFKNGGMG